VQVCAALPVLQGERPLAGRRESLSRGADLLVEADVRKTQSRHARRPAPELDAEATPNGSSTLRILSDGTPLSVEDLGQSQ